jgi:hypothetical protein
MNQEIFIVKIHNGLKDGKSLYDATKGNWKLNKARLNNIKYVVGVNRGEVVCAYVPTTWYEVEKGTEKGRSFFEGKEVDINFLLRMKESKNLLISKFGRGQAIAYASLDETE